MESEKINKQLYKNSSLAALFADNPPEGDGLFNPREPNLAILHEKPEHRVLLWMKAQGASNREISQQSGYTEPWLSQLFRQPWAQARLVEIMKEAGMDVTQQLLKSACPDSVARLIELRDSPATPEATVRNCCVDLIQFYLGKPKQQVEVTEHKQIADVGELDAEIARLEQEENRLKGVL
ncbi:MAG: hypothetical protein KGL39_41430 [Patescibacteria group bacterium]|nr:hypothetical protein [Patescibacteria group bacterium]